MPRQLTWADAIERVLADATTPLHYTEITDRIVAEGLRTSLGATPAATVGAIISASIKHEKAKSPYVRVGKGVYALATSGFKAPEPTEAEPEVDEVEEQYAVVSSFGMFWRRELVDWTRSPNVLGKQYGADRVVDFSDQRGVYLLYDGREVIYAGRATERGLGTRLYEHTWDRLSARWDRFSWFGMLPVDDSGKLGALPESFDSSLVAPALEAILVEALEPRQNRKRGDDLIRVEYIQQEDPAVRKRRLKAAFEEALEQG